MHTMTILGLADWLFILIIVGIIILVYLGISFKIYRKIFYDYNKPPIDLVDHTEDFYKKSYEWWEEIPKSEIKSHAYDGVKLHGWYVPPYDKDSPNLAIVVHGYQSKATDMIIIAKMYAEMGFQVMLPDLRGHGDSTGDYTTFGHHEKFDLKRWVLHALRNYGANKNILIHGVSMGAAATIMATGLDIPKDNVKFLVLDSGYTRLSSTLASPKKTRFLRFFYLGINIFTLGLNRYLLWRVNPIRYMRKNTIPFLIVQSEDDTAVPKSMAKHLYNASPAVLKDVYYVPDSKHALGFKDDYEGCRNKVLDMIKPIFNIKKIYSSKE